MTSIFHDGNRVMQDRFDTRRFADRIEEVKVGDTIDERDRAFIESREVFFRRRMHLNGIASIDDQDPLRSEYPEAQFIVRVRAHGAAEALPARDPARDEGRVVI